VKSLPSPSQKTLLGLAVFLGIVTVMPFLSQYGVAAPHEEGLMTAPAWRLWDGEVPYRDFSTRANPGTYYVLAALYATVSASVVAARTLVVLLSVVIAGCLQRIGSRFLDGWWSLLPVALFVCTGITHFPIVNHHWSGMASLLVGLLCLIRWDENTTGVRAAVLGAAVAACWWFLQLDGGVLGLTVLLYAFVFRPPNWIKNLAFMAISFFSFSLLLWSHMLFAVGPQSLWEYSILEPLRFHVAWNEVEYSWKPLRNSWNAFQTGWSKFSFNGPALKWFGHSLSYLLVWFIKYGLYYVGLWGAILAVAIRKGKVPRPILFVLATVAIMTLIQGRQDMLYINYLNTGWFVLVSWMIWEFFPVRVVWAGLLVSVFAVQYVFGFLDSLEYRYPIRTLRGTYYSKNPQEAGFFQAFYDHVQKLSPPGSFALAYPYVPSFYFLTGTRNVGRPPIVLPLAYSGDILTDDILPRLAETKPNFIYRVPMTKESLLDTPGANPYVFFKTLEDWDQKILADYEMFKDLNVIQIYKRKTVGDPESPGETESHDEHRTSKSGEH
jgi:hypothetical protein